MTGSGDLKVMSSEYSTPHDFRDLSGEIVGLEAIHGHKCIKEKRATRYKRSYCRIEHGANLLCPAKVRHDFRQKYHSVVVLRQLDSLSQNTAFEHPHCQLLLFDFLAQNICQGWRKLYGVRVKAFTS